MTLPEFHDNECKTSCKQCLPKESQQTEDSGMRRKFIEFCEANPDACECRMYEC